MELKIDEQNKHKANETHTNSNLEKTAYSGGLCNVDSDLRQSEYAKDGHDQYVSLQKKNPV